MYELTDLLTRATEGVPADYFYLAIHGGPSVYRERVYCYELYHQLRSRWPSGSTYRLNGEVDKSGHPLLRDMRADHAKPDFLVHTPGDMEGNYAVIEVKRPGASERAIRADLDKLALFLREVNYRRAIYLVFGDELASSAARIRHVASEYPDLPAIELWLHEQAGQPASLRDFLTGGGAA